MYKVCIYIPEEALSAVKNAAFNAGAGKQGVYDRCAWQTKGEGQFRALEGSQPYIGKQQEVTIVPEYKVEMLCEPNCLRAVIQAIKKAHPYEEPAIDVIALMADERLKSF